MNFHLSLAVLEHQSMIVLPQPVLPPNIEGACRADAQLKTSLSTREVFLVLQERYFARTKVHDNIVYQLTA